MPSKPLWRTMFDLVERPLATFADSTVQSEAFMDATAVLVKLQRHAADDVRRMTSPWLELWGMPTSKDVHRLANQVASLEREVRRLARELENTEGAAPDVVAGRRGTSA